MECYSGFRNRRWFAWVLDYLIAWYVVGFVLEVVGGILLAVATGNTASEYELHAGGILAGVLLTFLFLIKDGFRGHSPGKAITGLRVVDATIGWPAGFGASFKRNLPLLIPFVPFFVAGQLGAGKRIGDGWANTQVIWKKYADRPPFFVAQEGNA